MRVSCCRIRGNTLNWPQRNKRNKISQGQIGSQDQPFMVPGPGGVGREPWTSKTILLPSREGCERTEKEGAWEDLVTGRAGTTPNPPFARGGKPNPPFARGGKRRNETGMKAQLVQDQLFTSRSRSPV